MEMVIDIQFYSNDMHSELVWWDNILYDVLKISYILSNRQYLFRS